MNNLVLHYIRYKQLNWYGHVKRMNEEWLPKKNGMRPHGRRGRPQNSWIRK